MQHTSYHYLVIKVHNMLLQLTELHSMCLSLAFAFLQLEQLNLDLLLSPSRHTYTEDSGRNAGLEPCPKLLSMILIQ